MKKLYFVLVLAILFMFMGTGNLLAADDIKVYVNGNQVTFPDQKPMINADSRTLVPVRFVSEALGADVEWDGVTNTVSIAHEGKVISLVIGQKRARVDEDSIVLDTAAALVNSRTMVPLRFVSECLGAKVEWMSSRQEVYIITNLPEARAYQGTAYKSSGLPRGENAGFPVRETNGQNMNVKVSELPAQLGSEHIIYDVQFGSKYISVKQWSGNSLPCRMLIAEHGVITRQRSPLAGNITTTFTWDYEVNLATEQATRFPKPPLDIKNVSHVIFETYSGGAKYLTVANPNYKGE